MRHDRHAHLKLARVLPLPQPPPELTEAKVGERSFHRERTRAWVGLAHDAAAGVIGYPAAPMLALLVFLALPNVLVIMFHQRVEG